MTFLEQLSVKAVLLYSIAIAIVLVYLPFLVVAYGRAKVGYDTSAPRALFSKLPPFAQRATWAHENSFESFSLFTAAALMAYVTEQTSPWVSLAAIAYLGARLLFSVFYILDVPVARSMMFGVGSLCIGTLVVLSLLKVSTI